MATKQKYRITYHGKPARRNGPARTKRQPRPSSQGIFPFVILAAVMAYGLCVAQRSFIVPEEPAAYTPEQQRAVAELVVSRTGPTIEEILDAVETVESGGDCSAVSRKGARGCWQIMPSTAQDPGFGVEPLRSHAKAEQRRFARDYLLALHARYRDWRRALAAYNGGISRADNGNWPDETVDYVEKVERELERS